MEAVSSYIQLAVNPSLKYLLSLVVKRFRANRKWGLSRELKQLPLTVNVISYVVSYVVETSIQGT